jgi:hypothetical protein
VSKSFGEATAEHLDSLTRGSEWRAIEKAEVSEMHEDKVLVYRVAHLFDREL